MTKEQALKAVGDLSKASARVALLTNTQMRGSSANATQQEFQAAKRILSEILPDNPATDKEIEQALGY